MSITIEIVHQKVGRNLLLFQKLRNIRGQVLQTSIYSLSDLSDQTKGGWPGGFFGGFWYKKIQKKELFCLEIKEKSCQRAAFHVSYSSKTN